MVAPKSNYGTKFGFQALSIAGAFTDIAEILNIEIPEVSNDPVEVTNHGSLGVREYISGMLASLSPFKVSVLIDDTNIDTYDALVKAGTVNGWQITHTVGVAGTNWKFMGVLTDFVMNPADAMSPDKVYADLTIQPTGAIS